MLNKCLTKQICGVDGCKDYHHSSLHGLEKSAFSHSIHKDATGDRNWGVILPIMKVRVNSRSHRHVSCLWDGGADISLITNSKARQLNLKGHSVKLYITTAGGHKSVIDSFAYNLELLDLQGNIHSLIAYGIDRITESHIYQYFRQ